MLKIQMENKIKNLLKLVFATFIIGTSFQVLANQGNFCAGFEEGYKTIKGDMVIVPICPIAPITPIGSTDFREGIKAGMRAANR